jgi:hypothetical protein
MSVREGRRAPLGDYLTGTVVFNGGVQLAIAAALSALAVSRARAHVLSPAALAVVVALATVGLVAMAWANGAYAGAWDALAGDVVVDDVVLDDASAASDRGVSTDLLRGRRTWSIGARWGLVAGIWAAAGSGLVAVALNEKRARWIVIAMTWAVLAGGAAVAADTLARRSGVLTATRRTDAAAVPLRRRAWSEVALPLAVVQGATNMVVAWLLFHDYTTGRAAAAGTGAATGALHLTDKVALADATFVIVLLTVTFGFIVRRWGAVDAALGRVALDEPAAQDVPAKVPLGRQGLVYVGIAGLFLARLLVIALPATPSLFAVILVRGVFTGVLLYAVAGVAYVRGALNPAGFRK